MYVCMYVSSICSWCVARMAIFSLSITPAIVSCCAAAAAECTPRRGMKHHRLVRHWMPTRSSRLFRDCVMWTACDGCAGVVELRKMTRQKLGLQFYLAMGNASWSSCHSVDQFGILQRAGTSRSLLVVKNALCAVG
jgi:hypothetical protein